MIEIVVDEKKICIAETISGLRACSSRCPHAGGNMSQGKVDKNANIICPVHGYMFSLDSGRDKGGEGYFLKIYPVKENEEGVFIGLEETFLQDK